MVVVDNVHDILQDFYGMLKKLLIIEDFEKQDQQLLMQWTKLGTVFADLVFQILRQTVDDC